MKNTTNIPDFVKTPVKFLVSPKARKRILRESRIRQLQNEAIEKFDATARKLVVFLVHGPDRSTGREKISGGIMSIVSICEESARMKDIHQAEVILCTLPNEHLLLRHELFANNTTVFRFSQLRKYFTELKEVILHVPEYTAAYFLEHLNGTGRKWLLNLGKVQINILNQNIQLMPDENLRHQLKALASLVTITTAHDKYCSQQYRNEYGVPLHKLSVWISPEKYNFTAYHEKENLMVVSPDMKPGKQVILDELSRIPGLRIQIIQQLTYEEYKETIARAKWALTFGEGLDGYIIEPIFSGAIGFAVYNEDFFTADFQALETIYPSYEALKKKIVADIENLDHAGPFANYQQKQFRLCAQYYSQETYRENIRKFYKEVYSFP